MNKREFVLATGGALACRGSWAAAAPDAAAGQAAAELVGGADHWRSRIGERFDIYGRLLPAHLVLKRVDEHAGDGRTAQFSLVFESSETTARAGTQILRSGSGGALALYLDRASDDGAVLMRADFCQLT